MRHALRPARGNHAGTCRLHRSCPMAMEKLLLEWMCSHSGMCYQYQVERQARWDVNARIFIQLLLQLATTWCSPRTTCHACNDCWKFNDCSHLQLRNNWVCVGQAQSFHDSSCQSVRLAGAYGGVAYCREYRSLNGEAPGGGRSGAPACGNLHVMSGECCEDPLLT